MKTLHAAFFLTSSLWIPTLLMAVRVNGGDTRHRTLKYPEQATKITRCLL